MVNKMASTNKSNSIVTPSMGKGQIRKINNNIGLTKAQKEFIGNAELASEISSEEDKKKGRPRLDAKKRKVTFDMTEDLIQRIDAVAQSYGMSRASYISMAIMKNVLEFETGKENS